MFCDGGLASCTICGGFEGTLPTECPGRHMYEWQKSGVWKSVLDFVDGNWHYGLTKLARQILEVKSRGE